MELQGGIATPPPFRLNLRWTNTPCLLYRWRTWGKVLRHLEYIYRVGLVVVSSMQNGSYCSCMVLTYILHNFRTFATTNIAVENTVRYVGTMCIKKSTVTVRVIRTNSREMYTCCLIPFCQVPTFVLIASRTRVVVVMVSKTPGTGTNLQKVPINLGTVSKCLFQERRMVVLFVALERRWVVPFGVSRRKVFFSVRNFQLTKNQ